MVFEVADQESIVKFMKFEMADPLFCVHISKTLLIMKVYLESPLNVILSNLMNPFKSPFIREL